MNEDDIAVVGMAGRFPGAGDLATYWRHLRDGVDTAARPTPRVSQFDAKFFGIDEAEAVQTDPQHRMFLETAWEAVEDAGYDVTGLTGPVGVFGAASTNQYHLLQLTNGAPPPVRQSADHLPTRVAYRLDLTGPAVAVQTACSGSLVAVCLAAQSLADFRCDFAIAGGTNVNLPEFPHPDDGLISPDGVCRAFDAAGAGAGYASGVGAVVLRRLADAVADGDHVYAVIRGWAVTNDGAGRGGYAVPGVDGQAAAVAEALAVAELKPADVGMIEAHGSGTRLGDAIEVAALRRVYQDVSGPIALGSVKTNIGYLDAACGVAGLIKAALAVRYGYIPASLHFHQPNPEIDFGPFVVPTGGLPWQPAEPRIAGVSAFGLGGTNAHVLLQQPPERAPAPAAGPYTLPLSTATAAALPILAARVGDYLAAQRPALADVAHTLATGRATLAHRTTVTCADLEEALAALGSIAAGSLPPESPALSQSAAPPGAGRRIPLPTYPFATERHWVETVVMDQ